MFNFFPNKWTNKLYQNIYLNLPLVLKYPQEYKYIIPAVAIYGKFLISDDLIN